MTRHAMQGYGKSRRSHMLVWDAWLRDLNSRNRHDRSMVRGIARQRERRVWVKDACEATGEIVR